MKPEEWKPVAEFPAYEVSNHGQIRRNGVTRTLTIDVKGYLKVAFSFEQKTHTRYIARLVATAFVGERPQGQVVRHKNGICNDNYFENLEYGTHSENELDKRRHGTAPIGEKHPASKLTASQVLAIRARYRKNSRAFGCNALGEEFGVTGHMVYRIVHRLAWRHIP